ncbi:uncharacterized protein LOC135432164 isoform X2 [Drosophila montana]|uniref:uncharacterized protein LOC135432164 isoform X2 n=1 Tax=Drosophila montana TaxID=40370 RepID=UPI00313AF323
MVRKITKTQPTILTTVWTVNVHRETMEEGKVTSAIRNMYQINTRPDKTMSIIVTNTNIDGRDLDMVPICPKYQNIQDARGSREDKNIEDCICLGNQAHHDSYQERQEYNRHKDQTYQENYGRTDADFNTDKNNEPANQQEHYDPCLCAANLPNQYNRKKQTFNCDLNCSCPANRKKEPYKYDPDCSCPANLKREPFKCNLDCFCPANRKKEPANQITPYKKEPYKDYQDCPCPENPIPPYKEKPYKGEPDCYCPENRIAPYKGNIEPEYQPAPVIREIEYPPEKYEPEVIPEKYQPEVIPEKYEPEIIPQQYEPEIIPEKYEPEIIPEKYEPEVIPEKYEPESSPKEPLTDQEDLKPDEVMLDCECPTSEDDAEKFEPAKEEPKPEPPIRAPCLCEAAVETDIDMTLTDRARRKKCNCSQDSLETAKLIEKKAKEEKNAIFNEPESAPPVKSRVAKGAKKIGKICSCKPPVFNKNVKNAKAASPVGPATKHEQLKQRTQSPVGAKPRSLSKRQNKIDDDGLNKFQALGGPARQYVYEMQDEIHIKVSNHQNGGYEVYKKHVNKSQTCDGLAILCSFRVPPTLAETTIGILNNHISQNAPNAEDDFNSISESQERPKKCFPIRNNLTERRNPRQPAERLGSNPFLKLNFDASKRDIIVLHPPVPNFRPSKNSLSMKDFEVENYEREHWPVERYSKSMRPMPKRSPSH